MPEAGRAEGITSSRPAIGVWIPTEDISSDFTDG
jgi:hypothetical protein